MTSKRPSRLARRSPNLAPAALALLVGLTACADRGGGAGPLAAAASDAAAAGDSLCAAESSPLEALAEPDAKDAAAAACEGLKRFLDAIPAEVAASYGFADRAEIARAELAAPYQVWSHDAKASELAFTGAWRFPVTVDGGYRALLTVSRVEGAFRAVDFGASALSHELEGLERERAVGSGARRVLLRLDGVRADLAAFPTASARVEESKFEPLASARAAEGGPRATSDAKTLLPWVRERLVKARLR